MSGSQVATGRPRPGSLVDLLIAVFFFAKMWIAVESQANGMEGLPEKEWRPKDTFDFLALSTLFSSYSHFSFFFSADPLTLP